MNRSRHLRDFALRRYRSIDESPKTLPIGTLDTNTHTYENEKLQYLYFFNINTYITTQTSEIIQ
jgi:hypothetical protein